MREILFRGKHANSGEWVCGGLASLGHRVYITQSAGTPPFDHIIITRILPETLGQYTGLTDKNGTKIFEGDIISLHTLYNNETTVEVVHFSNGGFFAGTYPIYNVGAPCNQNNITILGNVHDNPELLEVTK